MRSFKAYPLFSTQRNLFFHQFYVFPSVFELQCKNKRETKKIYPLHSHFLHINQRKANNIYFANIHILQKSTPYLTLVSMAQLLAFSLCWNCAWQVKNKKQHKWNDVQSVCVGWLILFSLFSASRFLEFVFQVCVFGTRGCQEGCDSDSCFLLCFLLWLYSLLMTSAFVHVFQETEKVFIFLEKREIKSICIKDFYFYTMKYV